MLDRAAETATADEPRAGRVIRRLGGLALGALAAITAVISYQHGLAVVQATGTHGFVALLVPLVADLMIFASSLALLDAAQNQQSRPPLAVVSLAFGIVATVAMNVSAGWVHGPGGALVSALAPVSLVLSYETLMGMVRRGRDQAVTAWSGGHGEDSTDHCPHGVAGTAEDAAVAFYLHARDCAGEPVSQRTVAAAFGLHRDKIGHLVKEAGRFALENLPAEAPAHTDNGQTSATAAR